MGLFSTSQLYTLFPITPQCLEAFFLPYKLNLNDYSQRTNGSDTKFSAKKSHVFFLLGLSPWRIAQTKIPLAPQWNVPFGRPFNRRQGTSVAFSGTVPAGIVPPEFQGVGWGAVVGWEFPWWFKGSLGNSPAAKGRKILILAGHRFWWWRTLFQEIMSMEFSGTPNIGTPFPYYSHTTPIWIPKDMGMVWE